MFIKSSVCKKSWLKCVVLSPYEKKKVEKVPRANIVVRLKYEDRVTYSLLKQK